MVCVALAIAMLRSGAKPVKLTCHCQPESLGDIEYGTFRYSMALSRCPSNESPIRHTFAFASVHKCTQERLKCTYWSARTVGTTIAGNQLGGGVPPSTKCSSRSRFHDTDSIVQWLAGI